MLPEKFSAALSPLELLLLSIVIQINYKLAVKFASVCELRIYFYSVLFLESSKIIIITYVTVFLEKDRNGVEYTYDDEENSQYLLTIYIVPEFNKM